MKDNLIELAVHGPRMLLRFFVMAVLGAAFYLLLVGAVMAAEYTYYRAIPRDHIFHYESVEFAGPLVEGQAFEVISRSAWYWTVNVRWRDALECKSPDDSEFTLIHIRPDEKDGLGPSPMRANPWLYNLPYGVSIKAGDLCFMKAVATVLLPFGIEKQQIIYSKTMRVQSASS